jgi:predicted DNA-binding transcriptional regulator AlpA
MAKRKPAPTSQLDMFGGLNSSGDPSPATASETTEVPTAASERHRAEAKPANDMPPVQTQPDADTEADTASTQTPPEAALEAPPPAREPRKPAIPCSSTWVDEEWWTLSMVCAYLKLGRKAVWERKRDPKLGFPQPVRLGSSRPRWRGPDVRAWAGAQD